MASVDLANVSKSFGSVEAVRDVDLSIAHGELVVFVGPSGCGKSTLLRMIAGLEEISSGELLIGGKPMSETAAAKRGVAMVFQSYALYPHMNVAENMGFALKMLGVDRGEIKRKVEEAANVLQIGDLLERKPRELSGGQRQRVAIGRALVRDPDVFLFDEPLSNLDADLRAQMRVEIARLHERLGTTMIYVTHDQTEAMTLANRIVVLNKGRIEQEGRPLELYEQPRNRFVASFIGQPKMNFLPVSVQNSGKRSGIRLHPSGPLLVTDASSWGLEPGASMELGVRPNEIEMGGEGYIAGTVALVEQLGSATILHVSIEGWDGLLTVERPGKLISTIGERVKLRINPQHVHIFDQSGNRIGS